MLPCINIKSINIVQKAWKTCVHTSVSDENQSSSQTKGILHGLFHKILETCDRVANNTPGCKLYIYTQQKKKRTA